jgi:hypothetical protein
VVATAAAAAAAAAVQGGRQRRRGRRAAGPAQLLLWRLSQQPQPCVRPRQGPTSCTSSWRPWGGPSFTHAPALLAPLRCCCAPVCVHAGSQGAAGMDVCARGHARGGALRSRRQQQWLCVDCCHQCCCSSRLSGGGADATAAAYQCTCVCASAGSSNETAAAHRRCLGCTSHACAAACSLACVSHTTPQSEGKILVKRANDTKRAAAMHGLSR